MKHTNINLQKLIDLSQKGFVDPDLIEVSVNTEKLTNMLFKHLGISGVTETQTVVNSDEDKILLENEKSMNAFITNWKNAAEVFCVSENTLRQHRVAGVTWKGVVPEKSKKTAMVEVDLGHPKLAAMNLTPSDFQKKRKRFYTTKELMKKWGFATSKPVFVRFAENEKFKVGDMWRFPVDIADSKWVNSSYHSSNGNRLKIV